MFHHQPQTWLGLEDRPREKREKALPNAKKGDKYTVSTGAGNTNNFVYEYDGKIWSIIDFYKTPANGAIEPDYTIEEIFIRPLKVIRNILGSTDDDGFSCGWCSTTNHRLGSVWKTDQERITN